MSDSLERRLKHPLWCHSDAPFDSPQLAKEETLQDLADALAELHRLRELNAEMLASLLRIAGDTEDVPIGDRRCYKALGRIARAAIAKATGTPPEQPIEHNKQDR